MVKTLISSSHFFIIIVIGVQWAIAASAESSCNDITIVDRKGWGVNWAPRGNNLKLPVKYVFIHHSNGSSCHTETTCKRILTRMMRFDSNTRKLGDIAFNFLIGGDGKVYEGRGWQKVGAHTPGWDVKGIGIVFLGKYEKNPPPDSMQNIAKNLIQCGVSKGKINSSYGLYGHKDGSCTTCPGTAFYNALKKWPKWHQHGKIKLSERCTA